MDLNQHKNSLPKTDVTGLVFIVDDHPENIRVLGNILRNSGYKLAIAADGAQALRMINQKLFYILSQLLSCEPLFIVITPIPKTQWTRFTFRVIGMIIPTNNKVVVKL